jgi:hypothetical protein
MLSSDVCQGAVLLLVHKTVLHQGKSFHFEKGSELGTSWNPKVFKVRHEPLEVDITRMNIVYKEKNDESKPERGA